MLDFSFQNCKNTLLRSLPEDDFSLLAECLERFEFAQRDVLFRPGESVESIVFPESGIFSLVIHGSDERGIEAGLFGRDGMSDGWIGAGIDSVPLECFVQVAGTGLRMKSTDLARLAEERPAILRMLFRWVHMLGLQTAQTALANGNYNVEERLARWLLMCQDRLGRNEIQLTHDFLSVMLAVRRSTVTLAIHLLEGSRLISAKRGNITILDREALMGIADGSYGAVEAEYERYIGPLR
ncbi:helix-turn-helix domain-containing protein [Aurantimonas aggregata]|uniref:Helix-turn-helix domain-containing protein n=2 Tax=Aurantimonas aggregata TaxID=2047720 RepID=A0A6L9MCE0_9HYPH|nr:helix-turn-helix domain-containing protein [Aurantimonas aggregata]